MEFVNTFDCNVLKRNGKQYVNITKVQTEVKCEDYLWTYRSDTAIPFLTKTMNHMVNANWRIIFMENELSFKKFASKTFQAFLTPIFNEFAIQEFF